MGTILAGILLVSLFGSGGGFYARGRAGSGLIGILGIILISFVALWFFGGHGGV